MKAVLLALGVLGLLVQQPANRRPVSLVALLETTVGPMAGPL